MGSRPATDHDGARPSSDRSSPERPEDVARAVVLRRLAMGPRTRAQLHEAILAKDVPVQVADAVLDRFTEVGLIDDAQYAAMLVRSRHASRGLARRALAVELRRKGVGDAHAQEALAQVDDAAEERAARDLLRRRFSAAAGLDPQVQARRAMAMLGRKGYSSGLSARLVREMVDDRGPGPGESWEPSD